MYLYMVPMNYNNITFLMTSLPGSDVIRKVGSGSETSGVPRVVVVGVNQC